MRRAIDRTACALALTLGLGLSGQALAAARCDKPVYLTIDTGHMGVAPLVADVLTRHQVKATFFLANERTQAVGARAEGSSLDEHWAAWWKQLAAQGHDFGSHTWDHVVWQADTAEGLRVKPTAGPRNGERQSLSATAYCEQLQRPATRRVSSRREGCLSGEPKCGPPRSHSFADADSSMMPIDGATRRRRESCSAFMSPGFRCGSSPVSRSTSPATCSR